VLGFHEVEVFGGHRHGFPVEAAFEQEGSAGVAGALEAGFEFALETLVLFGGEIAVARGVDERAAGARGVVEKRLSPTSVHFDVHFSR
jgi:hypothetical protein